MLWSRARLKMRRASSQISNLLRASSSTSLPASADDIVQNTPCYWCLDPGSVLWVAPPLFEKRAWAAWVTWTLLEDHLHLVQGFAVASGLCCCTAPVLHAGPECAQCMARRMVALEGALCVRHNGPKFAWRDVAEGTRLLRTTVVGFKVICLSPALAAG